MTTIDFSLKGSTALITGAGRGIGRACASALASAGAGVVLVSRTSSEILALADEIAKLGGRAEARTCDVTDYTELTGLFQSLNEPIDILLNNAGTNIPEPFTDVSQSNLQHMIGLNVTAVFNVSQFAARSMVASGKHGSIIHITSQLGHVGYPGRSVYTMTKHAIEGLAKAMALELAEHNIRVNTIAPTFIETAMTRQFLAAPGFRDAMVSRIPLGHLGSVDDVAAAAVFLSSDAASMITGTSIKVDGGWTAQ